MYKIAVLDDDNYWGMAVKRFFRNDFEVTIFREVDKFLSQAEHYDLVMIDFSIPSARYETSMTGSEIISYLKKTLRDPPVLALASGFISKNDIKIGEDICPEADIFIAKDAGLETILQQIKGLIELRINQQEMGNRESGIGNR